ncbi:heat shock protein beta-6 [Hippocampus comes]|uniref:Heat shock protein, alpha-crystallin-related, b6 n=1 Tax=Hippocampus comes TaxID=109280 RepID=A0A3Q2YQ30_HIPCM|nr:PREDICTED: heat shock protein beta-6 [Hippocampus comes]
MQLQYITRLCSAARSHSKSHSARGTLDTPLHSTEEKDLTMDFIQPSTLPVGGIQWEKVLPTLFPRLHGTYGQYSWTPQLLIPEIDSTTAAEAICDDSGFKVQVDVKLFNPKDLLVKVVGDFVEVQGRHQEEKKDSPGMTTRQFNRRYRIPKGVDTMALESAVSPDGVLIISAPMLQTEMSRSQPFS